MKSSIGFQTKTINFDTIAKNTHLQITQFGDPFVTSSHDIKLPTYKKNFYEYNGEKLASGIITTYSLITDKINKEIMQYETKNTKSMHIMETDAGNIGIIIVQYPRYSLKIYDIEKHELIKYDIDELIKSHISISKLTIVYANVYSIVNYCMVVVKIYQANNQLSIYCVMLNLTNVLNPTIEFVNNFGNLNYISINSVITNCYYTIDEIPWKNGEYKFYLVDGKTNTKVLLSNISDQLIGEKSAVSQHGYTSVVSNVIQNYLVAITPNDNIIVVSNLFDSYHNTLILCNSKNAVTVTTTNYYIIGLVMLVDVVGWCHPYGETEIRIWNNTHKYQLMKSIQSQLLVNFGAFTQHNMFSSVAHNINGNTICTFTKTMHTGADYFNEPIVFIINIDPCYWFDINIINNKFLKDFEELNVERGIVNFIGALLKQHHQWICHNIDDILIDVLSFSIFYKC